MHRLKLILLDPSRTPRRRSLPLDGRRASRLDVTARGRCSVVSVLEFIANMTGSLAWPVVVLVAVVVLREKLAAMLAALTSRVADIKNLRAPGVEVEFEKRTQEVRQEVRDLGHTVDAPRVADEPNPPRPPRSDIVSTALDVAAIDPRAAVISVFAEVENTLRQIALAIVPEEQKANIERMSARRLAIDLQERGLLSDDAVRIVIQLSALRNEAVHKFVPNITVDAALDFIETCEELMNVLGRIGGRKRDT